jgi:hypothetical protein
MENNNILPIQLTQNTDTQINSIHDDEYLIPPNLLNENHYKTNTAEDETQPVITQQKHSQPFGDLLTTTKHEDTIRIYLKNINGIKIL